VDTAPVTSGVLIRKVQDIGSLQVGQYGLPMTPYLPLIDAAVQPNLVFQLSKVARRGVAAANEDGIYHALPAPAVELKFHLCSG
jgi:hypothetical protein